MWDRASNYIAFTFALLLTCLAFFILFASDAQSHSWYPYNCCSDRDCAPITEWKSVPGGALVTTIHGTFGLSQSWINENSQPSKDWKSHLCVKCDKWQSGRCVTHIPRNKCMFIGGGV